MKKIVSIFLMTATLLSLTLQGQALYRCHSENTVHLTPSCCDGSKVEVKNSCCSTNTSKSSKSQFKSVCCSKIDINYSPNIKSGETEYKIQGNDSFKVQFYLLISNSTQSNNTPEKRIDPPSQKPPPNHLPRYILYSSFLC